MYWWEWGGGGDGARGSTQDGAWRGNGEPSVVGRSERQEKTAAARRSGRVLSERMDAHVRALLIEL